MRTPVLASLVALQACKTTSATIEETGELPDTGSPTAWDDASWYCAEGTVSATTADEGWDVQTEHYDLHLEVSGEEEAEELGMLAEASWHAMASFFGKAPPGTLKAGWYGSYNAYVEAVAFDGGEAPDAGGYYWPTSKEAYMWTQPTLYFSRMLFLHELTHQFHYLARTGNQERDAWYAEGIAEHLSRHDWDGSCVRLGRLPMLSWEDYPADALSDGSFDLAALLSSGEASRPWSWATVRYLATQEEVAWTTFSGAYDSSGGDSAELFASYVGDPAELGDDIGFWLVDEQEPMSPIFLDWVHMAPGQIQAVAPSFSAARYKDDGTMIASHPVPDPGGYAGVLTAFEDSSNYSAVLVGSDGTLSTFSAVDAVITWQNIGMAPEADGGLFNWQVSGADVEVNGTAYSDESGLAAVAGLAVYASNTTFEGIELQP